MIKKDHSIEKTDRAVYLRWYLVYIHRVPQKFQTRTILGGIVWNLGSAILHWFLASLVGISKRYLRRRYLFIYLFSGSISSILLPSKLYDMMRVLAWGLWDNIVIFSELLLPHQDYLHHCCFRYTYTCKSKNEVWSDRMSIIYNYNRNVLISHFGAITIKTPPRNFLFTIIEMKIIDGCANIWFMKQDFK